MQTDKGTTKQTTSKNGGESGVESAGNNYNNQLLINHGQIFQGCTIDRVDGPASGDESPEENNGKDDAADAADDSNDVPCISNDVPCINDVMETLNTMTECLAVLYPDAEQNRQVLDGLEKATTAVEFCETILMPLSGRQRRLGVQMIRNCKFSAIVSESTTLKSYVYSHNSRNLHDAFLRATDGEGKQGTGAGDEL